MSKFLEIPNSGNGQAKEQEGSGFLDFLNKDISFGGARLDDKLKEQFYNDLGVLLSAGVDLKSALELFSAEVKKTKLRDEFLQILNQVIQGKSLSTVMKENAKFTPYECVSIQIGEETGEMVRILSELSSHFSRRIKLKRQIVSVFSYPTFLLTVTFGVLYFMLNNVVPMFAEVFQRFGKELPSFTLAIIKASNYVQDYGIWFLGSILIVVVAARTQRKKNWFRKALANFLLRVPVFGTLIHKVYLARFCQSMQLLISARIPLVEALALVRGMINFYPFEHALQLISSDIVSGKALHEGMHEFPIFERRLVSLVKVAEEVNQLDRMFERLAKQYNDEVEYRTSILGSLIEPLMILLIGLIVGVILIAMYQPLFNISTILE